MKSKVIGKLLGLFVLGALVSACGSDDRRLRDRAAIQSQEAAVKAVEEENKNKERWAARMEEDLQRRYAFYESLSGTYVGRVPMETSDFEVRLNLRLNQTAYDPERTRTVEEIQEELERLSFTAEITLSSLDGLVAAGCVFEEIKPNLKTGDIFLASEECKQVYDIFVSDEDLMEEVEQDGDLKESYVFDPNADYKVQSLQASIRFLLRAGEYDFELKRLASNG